MSKSEDPFFTNLSADEETGVTEIPSLCMVCRKQGTTRLLLTKIPLFKEVIITSFSCDHCGEQNTFTQSAGELQSRGITLKLEVTNLKDLNRQVVKSEYATVAIPQLQFENPPVNRKGEVSTVEGLIQVAIDGLKVLQPERQVSDPETAQKIDEFIKKLENIKEVNEPFTLVVTDPSGNSFIENPNAPKHDENLKIEHWERNKEQNVFLGLEVESSDSSDADDAKDTPFEGADKGHLDLKHEVLEFPCICSNCRIPSKTRMKVVDIPYFKQVVLMATTCDNCGYKDNEVKGGTGIEPLGTRITLHMTKPEDMCRDLLKSDFCGVKLPVLEMELGEGTLGSKFTTVEGLLTNILDQMSTVGSLSFGFHHGDSSTEDRRKVMDALTDKLKRMLSCEIFDYDLILDDPSGNSYLQNLNAPEPDPNLTVERYERTDEQNEMLGLKDMCTENYY